MSNPTAAILIIGDEILSGRTREANMHYLAGVLTAHGIELREARMVVDDHEAIVDAVRALASSWDIVFTSGGIGPTHDDITADAVADAFGVHIDVRDDALAILQAHYANSEFDLNEARLRMARIPDGAELIDNPVSGAPGFRIENVHVCAGVPRIFQAMVEAVLPGLAKGAVVESRSLRVERPEGEIAGPLGKIASAFPGLSFGSYPFQENGAYGANVVIRGTDTTALSAAVEAVSKEFEL